MKIAHCEHNTRPQDMRRRFNDGRLRPNATPKALT